MGPRTDVSFHWTRGRELVDQILAYRRNQRGKHQPTELCRAVAETIELIAITFPSNHAIVSDLSGAIDVKSTPGQGSTFSIYRPLIELSAPLSGA